MAKWYGKQINTEALIELKARIREVRLACGLSQAKLGKLAGTGCETSISRLESTATLHWPSLPLLMRLADALEVSVTDLLPDRWNPRAEASRICEPSAAEQERPAPEESAETRPARRGECNVHPSSGVAPL